MKASSVVTIRHLFNTERVHADGENDWITKSETSTKQFPKIPEILKIVF